MRDGEDSLAEHQAIVSVEVREKASLRLKRSTNGVVIGQGTSAPHSKTRRLTAKRPRGAFLLAAWVAPTTSSSA
jgi:hypothetical protein